MYKTKGQRMLNDKGQKVEKQRSWATNEFQEKLHSNQGD